MTTFTGSNMSQVNDDLFMVDWEEQLNHHDPELCFQRLVHQIQVSVRLHCSKRSYPIPSNKSNVWIDDDIRAWSKIKRQLYDNLKTGDVSPIDDCT